MWMYYGSLQLGRTGSSVIWKLFSSRQVGKAFHPKNWILQGGSLTNHALRWQPYFDEVGKDCPRWSIPRRQEWGLFLLEWLFQTAATLQSRDFQCHMQRCSPLPPNHSGWGCSPHATGSTEPCWVLQMMRSWNWLKRFIMDSINWSLKHPPPSMPGPVNEWLLQGTRPMTGEG